MWRELKETDDNLDVYVDLKNIYDCSAGRFTSNELRQILEKKLSRWFVYEDDIYTILLAFRFNTIHNKSQYVAFAIKPSYTNEAFKTIGQKTREYLIETNTELVLLFNGIEIYNPMAISEGTENLFSMIRIAFKEIGLVGETDFVNKISLVRVDDNWLG